MVHASTGSYLAESEEHSHERTLKRAPVVQDIFVSIIIKINALILLHVIPASQVVDTNLVRSKQEIVNQDW